VRAPGTLGTNHSLKMGSGTRSITRAIRTAMGTILHIERLEDSGAHHFGRDEGEVWDQDSTEGVDLRSSEDGA